MADKAVSTPSASPSTVSGLPRRTAPIQAIGDSMEPTLAAGDDVIVDRSDGNTRLRDGIYVLRADDQLLVKRLARVPTKIGLIVHSDNPAYPSWEPRHRAEVDVVGRVLWFGRKVG